VSQATVALALYWTGRILKESRGK